MNAPAPILDVCNVSAGYANAAPALTGVSFQVQAGERVALIGPNGAGKSTLMKCIMGLLPCRTGEVHLHGRLGYVPQEAGVDWDFPVTVRETVLMARTRQIGWLRRASAADWDAVEGALARVGLAAVSHRPLGALSGGQRRRVFIARALAQSADLLLLDEPFSGVDPGAQNEIMEVLLHLNAEGLTLLLSTHDLELAFKQFDKVLAVRGHLVGFGSPQAVAQSNVLRQLFGAAIPGYGQAGEPAIYYVDDHHCHD